MKKNRYLIFVVLAAVIALTIAAIPGAPDGPGDEADILSADIPAAGYTFTISKSGSTYSAVDGAGVITITSGTLQSVIGQIDTAAGAAAKKLIFGNGTAVLDLGSDTAVLQSGEYIIEGKVTSAGADGTLRLESGASLYMGAVAAAGYTGPEMFVGAIFNNSTGTAHISGGTVSATSAIASAVFNNSAGTVNISGGTITIEGSSGYAVWNNGAGIVNISGGTITATGNVDPRAVSNNAGTVNISGGILTATGDLDASTVCNGGATGTVNISGGTISTTDGRAVRNQDTGTVNISGGTVSVSERLGIAVYNMSTGTVNVSGGTVKAATGDAIFNSRNGIIKISDTALVTSACTETSFGTIFLANDSSATDTRLFITGGTVTNTAGGKAIYNESVGEITVSGGTVSATTGIAINDTRGVITISGTASVTSANPASDSGTIYMGNAAAGTINVAGGTITNTAGGNVIYPAGSNVNITAVPVKGPAIPDIEKDYDGKAVTMAPKFQDLGVVVSAQWYKDDKLISGANSMTLSVKSDADNGVYVLKVRYAAAAGTTGEITSDPITVKITGSEGGGFPILIVVALIAVIAVAGAAVYLFVLKK